MSTSRNALFVKYVWSVIAMPDTERSFRFGKVFCVTENQFREIDQNLTLQLR